ncbi:MAG: hypothetical protein KKD65_03830 [Gammaproteobacteria bacterium]|nr:hypothetical protein [Gammaproteobacteria bacterium]
MLAIMIAPGIAKEGAILPWFISDFGFVAGSAPLDALQFLDLFGTEGDTPNLQGIEYFYGQCWRLTWRKV